MEQSKTPLRLAVIGHVEWVQFVPVERMPAPGDIVHGDAPWEEPAGGGGVAAAELARLAGSATLFTALGDDDAAQQVTPHLQRLGVQVHAARHPLPQRRAITLIDPSKERSIVVVGPSLDPGGDDFDPGVFADFDGIYFCKGDAALLRAARRARILVATARVLPILQEAGVVLDALVHSGNDPGERYAPGDLVPAPRLVATTDGPRGGTLTLDGSAAHWDAAPLPGPAVDAYGAGDSFAAGLTFALAEGRPPQAAAAFAATRGALANCRRGAHGE